MELGYIHNRFMPIQDMTVSVHDRGYLFGDGIYEVTRVHEGKLFAGTYHHERLFRSLREMEIEVPFTLQDIVKIEQELIQKSGIAEGFIYLQVTRGEGPRHHSYYQQGYQPILMMYIKEFPTSYQAAQNGVKAISHEDLRWHRCDIKTLNLIANTMAQSKADEKGCYSAILFRDGICTEGAASNVFVVKDGLLYTHPATDLILNGTTRRTIIEVLAPRCGIKVCEETFGKEWVVTADELFFSSSLGGILPILALDGKPIGKGTVGPVTASLQQAMADLLAQGFA